MIRFWLVLGALLATPAAAEAPAAAASAVAAPDPATLAAARDLMRVTDVQGQMHALMPRMAEATGAQLRQMFTDQKMPDGLQRQVTAAIQANMVSMQNMFTPAVIDQMAAVYARHFKLDELKRLTALMQDPVMARYRTEMPDMMGEIMPILFETIKPQQALFQAKMRQIIADWIQQHPEDKAKLRSPAAS